MSTDDQAKTPPPKWSCTRTGAVLLRGEPLTMKDAEVVAELVADANRAETLTAALIAVADQLDAWAFESRTDGWSTHQVEPMRKLALHLRVKAHGA